MVAVEQGVQSQDVLAELACSMREQSQPGVSEQFTQRGNYSCSSLSPWCLPASSSLPHLEKETSLLGGKIQRDRHGGLLSAREYPEASPMGEKAQDVPREVASTTLILGTLG